jgi:sugar lactone lactonase YvrE
MPAASVEVVVNLHARLGEGPRWDHRKGLLAWVDILGGHVHQTDPASGFTTTIQVGPEVGALALYGDDGYLLAIRNGFATLANAEVVDFQPVFGEADARMNDGVVDPAGRFVAGSMGRDATPGMGSLYQRVLDGSVQKLFGGVTISNGLAWSARGDQMYYVDSGLPRIDLMGKCRGDGCSWMCPKRTALPMGLPLMPRIVCGWRCGAAARCAGTHRMGKSSAR